MDTSKLLPRATGNSFGRHIRSGNDVLRFLTDVPDNPGIVGITCAGKTDGGGAQVLAVMSALTYSSITGVPYFHTPFTSIRFEDGEPDWHGRWERFFNLGEGEPVIPNDVPVLDASQYIEAGRPSGVIISLPHCHNFIHRDGTADAYSDEIRNSLRQKYANGAPKTRYTHQYIAFHIRRGDVSAGHHTGRFASNARVLDNLRLFRMKSGSELPLEVFSQGAASDFDFLPLDQVTGLHLDVDVFETISRMVCGQGLIMGRSSFSYLAALLGNGKVMTDLWYHRPLSSWLVPTGSGDALPWGRVIKNKRQTRRLQSCLKSDPKLVISEVEENTQLLKESPTARWLLALAYLSERQPEKAEPYLRELASGKSSVSNSARRTIANRYTPRGSASLSYRV